MDVRDLRKRYGDVEALRGIDLYVKWGEFFGFLGPNGAGKSTTIQVLTTLTMPTGGSVEVGGADVIRHPEDVRFRIGVALQDTGVDPLMTGRELLVVQGRLFGMTRARAKQRASELLKQFGLEDAGDRRVKTYSGGMRRRLDLALALVHEPGILFLDEPTTGLDPVNRMALWELLRSVNRDQGVTIFLTTQYLEEADTLCERIAIINHGEIIAEDTPSNLKRRLRRDVIELEVADADDARSDEVVAMLVEQGWEAVRDGSIVRVFSPEGAHDTIQVLAALEQRSVMLSGLRVVPPTLDDVFLQLTGAQLEGDEHSRQLTAADQPGEGGQGA